MSKINIMGIVEDIKSQINVYTPIVEAIVNSIEAIDRKNTAGEIIISVHRDSELPFDTSTPGINSIDIEDNGVGFNQVNRESFDTFKSDEKKHLGGKGFGRFMFFKYFEDVTVESVYQEKRKFFKRAFTFGKKNEIITQETNDPVKAQTTYSKVSLNNILKKNLLDKELETIARKILEKLLIFFVDDNFITPIIKLRESDKSKEIILNNYLSAGHEIQLIKKERFTIANDNYNVTESFEAKIFKIYFSHEVSKVYLASSNREVTESYLKNYIPEFEDDFFDEMTKEERITKKNYVVRIYVTGDYLDKNTSLERESFNFEENNENQFYPISQKRIEKKASDFARQSFSAVVNLRSEKKVERYSDYVNAQAPWHKPYLKKLDFTPLPYKPTDEDIEVILQKHKFHQEQEVKQQFQEIINAPDEVFDNKLKALMSNVTEIGKNDLAHYVSNRKLVIQTFKELLRRTEDGKVSWEKEIHNLIYPMGKDSDELNYEDHNLWLLDERVVFSTYIASDKKIGKKAKALEEPDLIVFDNKISFRNGENEFSNPLTVFEFKRPKRSNYQADDNPINQVGEYVEQIRAGKYELPDGSEKIKVNNQTPVYGYIICDIEDKIRTFAKQASMTVFPDDEGYFGWHQGYNMYLEIISFKKAINDAYLRNKIFFKKLQLE